MWLPFIPKSGGGKGPIAYHQDSNIEIAGSPMPLFLRVYYDCSGRPFGDLHRYTTRPGDIWKGILPGYVDSFGVLGHDFSDYSEGLTDTRTLEMLQENCCPPELLAEMLGGEGAPD